MILTSITRNALHVLPALLVSAALAAAAAAAGRPPQMSEQAYTALLARSQAVNDLYGSTAARLAPETFRAMFLRSEELNRRYQLGDHASTTATATAPATARPPQMSEQAYTALTARSQALNDLYGNAATGMTPEELRALYLRSQDLNRRYQLGDQATATGGTTIAASPLATAAPTGFDWADAGVGAGVAVGSVLLAAAAAVGMRKHVHVHLPAAHGR